MILVGTATITAAARDIAIGQKPSKIVLIVLFVAHHFAPKNITTNFNVCSVMMTGFAGKGYGQRLRHLAYFRYGPQRDWETHLHPLQNKTELLIDRLILVCD